MTSKTTASADTFADFLISGYWGAAGARHWASGQTVTYSFGVGWTSAMQTAVAAAFQEWSDVANISFQPAAFGGEINFALGFDGQADTQPTVSWGSMVSAKISIDTTVPGWTDLTTIGGYGFETLIHEIGHSLGLGHAGPYNGGSPTYSSSAIYTNDTRQYSIMSYFAAGADGQGCSTLIS